MEANSYTAAELAAKLDDVEWSGTEYVVPCWLYEALLEHLRHAGPSVPLELLEDCLAKIEAYSRELQGRYCGGVPNNILLPQLREAIKRLAATSSRIPRPDLDHSDGGQAEWPEPPNE